MRPSSSTLDLLFVKSVTRERDGITVQGRHAIILGTALTSGLPVIPI